MLTKLSWIWAVALCASVLTVPIRAEEVTDSAPEVSAPEVSAPEVSTPEVSTPEVSAQEVLGPNYDSTPWYHDTQRSRHEDRRDALERLRYWNEVANDTSGLDHTPVGERENRVFGHQFGPGRAARAMAIVHIAMFDAVNAVVGGYRSYTHLGQAPRNTSVNAAIAQSAHDTLVSLFPSHKRRLDALLAEDLRRIRSRDRRAKSNGIALGRQTARAILALQAHDGSHHSESRLGSDFIPSDEPGWWRQDPIGLQPIAMGARWGTVRPFVLRSPDQFRAPPPPAMDSKEYTAAFREVKRLGGDGLTTPTRRNRDQTEAGIYWAYDGTPSLCAPPRLYNQIAVQIARQKRSDLIETARLLALINVAMADAGIAIWESKYHYQVWRPVTGIREADEGTGPTGAGDGNPATRGDENFIPLGAPASNLNGPNFTPPFPAYPSGHAGFGGVLFEMLRNFYRTDRIAFTFVSDELNGITADNQGKIRPLRPRRFKTLSQAEAENAQSRIYLGIHWPFDASGGIAQGRRISDYVFRKAFLPRFGHRSKELDATLLEE